MLTLVGLLPSRNLADLTNVATAQASLSLVPGTNVQAHSSVLDSFVTGGGLSSITLTTSNTLHATPVTFTNTSGAWTGALTLNAQSANKVLAGPTSGGAAAPTMRSLVASDLPNTAVTPGSYTATNLTVDAQGRITAAANGSAGGGLTVGNAISGGGANRILWEDASGNLAANQYATFNTNGSLTIKGQAGEYPIRVQTPDGASTIFSVENTTGKLVTNGVFLSGGGFQVSAYGTFVGVGSAQRIVFNGNGMVAYGGNVTDKVFAIQGVASQTAPLVPLRGISSTSTERDVGYLDGGFVSSVDASYTGYTDVDANDSAGRRKGMRIASDGTQAKIGFFGVSPVARASAIAHATNSTDVITQLNLLIDAIKNLGLTN